MGIINEYLKDEGYNLKERTYILGGTISGAVAPIVAGRYWLSQDTGDSEVGEVALWGISVLLNASSMIMGPHLPIPAYTGLFGFITGMQAAEGSRRKRFRKSQLETYLNKNKE